MTCESLPPGVRFCDDSLVRYLFIYFFLGGGGGVSTLTKMRRDAIFKGTVARKCSALSPVERQWVTLSEASLIRICVGVTRC